MSLEPHPRLELLGAISPSAGGILVTSPEPGQRRIPRVQGRASGTAIMLHQGSK